VFESLPTVEESTVFSQIILKACQKNREERFQSCNEWLDQLKHPERKISYRKPEDIVKVKEKPEKNKVLTEVWGKVFSIALLILIPLITYNVFFQSNTDKVGENNTTVDTAVITDTPVYKDPQNDVNTNAIYTEEDLRAYPSNVSVIPPEYQGGGATYNDQIAGNAYNYTVVAKWEIDEDGTIPPSSIEILSGLECSSCTEEVTRAIKSSSGKWLPATINGTKVKYSKKDSFLFPK